jgi:hypothetical protein
LKTLFPFAEAHELQQRWPDLKLLSLFLELRRIYESMVRHRAKVDTPSLAIPKAYRLLCRWMEESLTGKGEPSCTPRSVLGKERFALHALVLQLKPSYGRRDWLQSLASLLGMLMHLSWSNQGTSRLVNRRRPQRSFSTYPNSPVVGRLAAKAVTSRLFKNPIPLTCCGATEATRYAEGALDFRILDPSMESGQLLLDVALACVERVHSVHAPDSASARHLIPALLKKLCADCLWGLDRNALALPSVVLVFSLLGSEYRVRKLVPSHLTIADSLVTFQKKGFAEFDAVINNPPWNSVRQAAERKRLRERFETIDQWLDLYVPFSELGVRCLRTGGVLALIIPSQVVAMSYTAKLRQLILSRIKLDELILLPRAAFADATVRAIMILGRARSSGTTTGVCRVMAYPFEKKISASRLVRTFTISLAALGKLGQASWGPLLNGQSSPAFKARTVTLDRLATMHSGLQVYGRHRGIPPQTADTVRRHPFTFSKPMLGTIPVIRGRDVHHCKMGRPQQFVKFGEWLAWIGKHESLRGTRRIFVRELYRRDGKLTAAVSRDGLIPLKGVLTVAPRGIGVYTLLGILNSMVAAHYVRQHGSSFSKVDFQRITIGELKLLPIPIAAIDPHYRAPLGLGPCSERENQLRDQLMMLVRKLSGSTRLSPGERERIQRTADEVVSAMFDLTEKDNDA